MMNTGEAWIWMNGKLKGELDGPPKPWKSSFLIKEEWRLGRLSFKVWMREKNSFMGRFGGGWNWKLGIQAGGQTLLFNLLVMTIIFKLEPRKT